MSYFVTPHAIRQFKERVCDARPAEIISAVLAELDKRKRIVENGRDERIYTGLFRGKPFYAIIVSGEGEWPAIATILGARSKLHGQFVKGKARIVYERN